MAMNLPIQVLPQVFNRGKIRARGWPIQHRNLVINQPIGDSFGPVAWCTILLEEGTLVMMLESLERKSNGVLYNVEVSMLI